MARLLEVGPVSGISDRRFAGERGMGATGRPTMFNGAPAATRACRNLSDAVLATTGPQYFSDHDGEHFMALAAKTSHKRMLFGGDCYNYGQNGRASCRARVCQYV